MIRIEYKVNIVDFKPLTFNLTNLSFSVLKVNGKYSKFICKVRYTALLQGASRAYPMGKK